MKMNNEADKGAVATCALCRNKGVLLYKEREDRLFGASGAWDYYKCQECDFIWLGSVSMPQDTGSLYSERFSHKTRDVKQGFYSLREKVKFSIISANFGYRYLSSGTAFDIIGKALSAIPALSEMAGLNVMMLPYKKGGRILDIGCGKGEFLNLMQKLGWEAAGVEIDARAAQEAKELFKIPVVANSLEEAGFPKESFDAITMHHVIEHLKEPARYLKECFELLKPAGTLVIVTPNIGSLASSILKGDCVHFSPPWHINLFSAKALSAAIPDTGFSVSKLFTSARRADSTWSESLKFKSRSASSLFFLKIQAMLFQKFEMLACLLNRGLGEEIVLILTKPHE